MTMNVQPDFSGLVNLFKFFFSEFPTRDCYWFVICRLSYKDTETITLIMGHVGGFT